MQLVAILLGLLVAFQFIFWVKGKKNISTKQVSYKEVKTVSGTCGQVRPGEWRCNCIDSARRSNNNTSCLVLKELKSKADSTENTINNRRAAIAAQKTRRRADNHEC